VDYLKHYRTPLFPVPERVSEACRRGVIHGEFASIQGASAVLTGPDPGVDGVRRSRDGRVLVTCTTDMPGVTPAMIDWWFGWHLISIDRYRLWHPRDHIACRVHDDRSHLCDDRQRYIGNVSYVDEYIGSQLKKLAIAFRSPAEIDMASDPVSRSTTIYATTSDRVLGGQGGHLVHHVIRTDVGSQMRSGFWLGQIAHSWPLVDRIASGVLNTSLVRRRIVPDHMAVHLLLHCAEEMNQLARILPELYAQWHPAQAAALG
jgi:hypothetical protein